MSWSMLEKLLSDVATHSTLIGKYWFSFLFVFRVIIVLSVGDKVYSDEQSKFVCNTLQPGCDNICFNQFSPISHIRFWAMQILLVCLPSIVFIVWAMHALSLTKERREKLEKELQQQDASCGTMVRKKVDMVDSSYCDPPPKYNGIDKKSESIGCFSNRKKKSKSSIHSSICENVAVSQVIPMHEVAMKPKTAQINEPNILTGYIIHIIFRMAIEATFIYFQYVLFRFHVPEMYRCEGYPCPMAVECFVSRPMEKNIFLYFMYGIASVCLFMDFMELKYFGIRKILHLLRRKHKTEPDKYLQIFEDRWHQDQVLASRFAMTGRRHGLRRHRDMSITDPESHGNDSTLLETSDDGEDFE